MTTANKSEKDRVIVFDTTLRDGEQCPGATMTHEEKIEVAELLETMVAALEASPVPKFEWAGLGRVFPAEDLASLLHISASSLKRYQQGERATPDSTAARLHFLALVVGDLAGSYNDVGIRRWFHRKRTTLDNRTPAAILAGEWDPDDDGPMRVRALARSLTTLSAT